MTREHVVERTARPSHRGWDCDLAGCGRPGTVVVSRKRGDGFQRRFCSLAHASAWTGTRALDTPGDHAQVADLLVWIGGVALPPRAGA